MSCRSETGFVWHQKPAPIRTLFYSKPETAVNVTEIIIFRRLLFILVISCKRGVNSHVVIYLFIVIHRLRAFNHVYFRRQKCSFQTRTYMERKTSAENRRQKMESIYGAGFWSVCHEYESGDHSALLSYSCYTLPSPVDVDFKALRGTCIGIIVAL